jgi:hypothetical protein
MRSSRALVLMAAVLATLARPGKASTGDVLRWTGEGEQVYACRATDTHYQWVLERPAATLIDDSGRRRGIHGEGPSWHADDGSIVYARAITTIPSPNPDAVPWLVLRASAHDGAGILAKVDYILRTETKGGVAPATGCDSTHQGAHAHIPYKALYSFIPAPASAAKDATGDRSPAQVSASASAQPQAAASQ